MIVELFQQVLELTVFSKNKTDNLVLVADLTSSQLLEKSESGTQSFPKGLFPQFCDLRILPSDETFIDEMKVILAKERPKRLFILPPLAGNRRLSDELHMPFPEMNLEEIVLEVILENLPLGCLFGVLLPPSFFISGHNPHIRKHVIERAKSICIISHEFSLYEAGFTNIPRFYLQTLILEIGQVEQPLVRFFKVPKLNNTNQLEDVIGDFKRLIMQGDGVTQYGLVLTRGISTGSPWTYDIYAPDFEQQVKDMQHFGEVRFLSELADIFVGYYPGRNRDERLDGNTEAGIPLIEGRDIVLDNRLVSEDTRYRIADTPANYQLQEGDICVSVIFAAAKNLKAVKIEKEMLPLAAAKSVLIVRPKNISEVDVSYLLEYLRSDKAVRLLKLVGMPKLGSNFRLDKHSLEKLPVPVADEVLNTALQNLREAARVFGRWKTEAEQIISSLFDLSSAKDARTHVLSAGRRIKQRQYAAQQVDEFGYRVRTRFPHPIAYRWRTVEAAKPDLEGYIHILECAEITVCYLACIAILSAKSVEDVSIGSLRSISQKLSQGRGTTFGDWLAILTEVNEKKLLKDRKKPIPFYEVIRLLDNEEAKQAIQLLKENRDAQSHGKGPKGSMVKGKFNESQNALEVLLKAIEFLTEYLLLYIEDTYRDSLVQVTRYNQRKLMGDHPLVTISQDNEAETAELEARSLYLADRSGKLHLLRPLLIRRECPECGRWSIFYLENYQKRYKNCILKSMEHEHTIVDPSLKDAFRTLGLLE